MARKAKGGGKKTRGGLKRRVLTGFLLALILYLGAHAIARTEGVRSIVVDKISNFTHQPVALKKCAATLLLGLDLKGLAFYGVEMPNVKVEWNWLAMLSDNKPFIRRIHIQTMEVKLKRIPVSGKWDPLVLHDLGNRLGGALGLKHLPFEDDQTLPQVPDILLNEKTALKIERAKIVWRDANGNELAYVDNADATVKVVNFQGREAVQFFLTAGHLKMADGKLIRDFELETIKIDGYKPVLVVRMASAGLEYDGFESQTLWQDLFSRLGSLSKP